MSPSITTNRDLECVTAALARVDLALLSLPEFVTCYMKRMYAFPLKFYEKCKTTGKIYIHYVKNADELIDHYESKYADMYPLSLPLSESFDPTAASDWARHNLGLESSPNSWLLVILDLVQRIAGLLFEGGTAKTSNEGEISISVAVSLILQMRQIAAKDSSAMATLEELFAGDNKTGVINDVLQQASAGLGLGKLFSGHRVPPMVTTIIRRYTKNRGRDMRTLIPMFKLVPLLRHLITTTRVDPDTVAKIAYAGINSVEFKPCERFDVQQFLEIASGFDEVTEEIVTDALNAKTKR